MVAIGDMYILKNIVWQLSATGPLLLLHRNKQVSEPSRPANPTQPYTTTLAATKLLNKETETRVGI